MTLYKYIQRHKHILGFCDRASWANCEVREKTNKMQQLDVYYQHFLNMFRSSLCPSSGEQRPCVTARGVLRWFCCMWLVVVVGRCVVGCEHCEGYCSTVLRCGVRAVWRLLFDCAVLWGVSTVKVTVPLCCVVGCEQCEGYCSTATNHIQQNQRSTPRAVTHVFVLLKMGIMMPETCWECVDNKYLTVASCWFSLSLHTNIHIVSRTIPKREFHYKNPQKVIKKKRTRRKKTNHIESFTD